MVIWHQTYRKGPLRQWERENLLLPLHGLLFFISSKGSLYTSSHRQDSTYHDLFYISRGVLAETRNRSLGPPWGIDLMTHRTMSRHSTMEPHLTPTVNWMNYLTMYSKTNYSYTTVAAVDITVYDKRQHILGRLEIIKIRPLAATLSQFEYKEARKCFI